MATPVTEAEPVPRETPGTRAASDRLVARLAAQGVCVSVGTAGSLVQVLAALANESQNLTAIRDLGDGVDRHLADSLVSLALPEVAEARRIVDIGSGGGFPGIPLAAALPGASVTLVESEARKARWLQRWAGRFPNLRVVADRSEHLAGAERESWDLATVRAVAAPAVALELAAPLVAPGGHLVLWRSSDGDPGVDRQAVTAAAELGWRALGPHPVVPFPGARRTLDRYRKDDPTPARYPRRPGMAAKRPLGAR
ncbi:MAG: class I SAM-dependent methyltransferase [Miltoncostaeaceae bacterium]